MVKTPSKFTEGAPPGTERPLRDLIILWISNWIEQNTVENKGSSLTLAEIYLASWPEFFRDTERHITFPSFCVVFGFNDEQESGKYEIPSRSLKKPTPSSLDGDDDSLEGDKLDCRIVEDRGIAEEIALLRAINSGE